MSMGRRRRTGCIVAAGVLLGFVAAPPLAGACNYPTLGLSTSSAGPGEIVPYTIVNAQPGAAYTLTMAGRIVASGTSSAADGHSGAFEMPALGSSQRVSVELVATHAGSDGPGHETGPWRDSESLDFAMPATADAPATQPAPAPATQPDAAPQDVSSQPAPQPAQATSPAAASQHSAGGQNSRARPATTPARSGTTQTAERGTARSRASSAPTRTVVASPVSARAVGAATVGTSTTKPRLSRPAAGGRRGQAIGTVRGARPLPAPVERPLAGAQADGAASPGAGGPPGEILLAGIALMLGILAQAGCVWARLRSIEPGSPAHVAPPQAAVSEHGALDDIEAELQQILAEAADHAAHDEQPSAPVT